MVTDVVINLFRQNKEFIKNTGFLAFHFRSDKTSLFGLMIGHCEGNHVTVILETKPEVRRNSEEEERTHHS